MKFLRETHNVPKVYHTDTDTNIYIYISLYKLVQAMKPGIIHALQHSNIPLEDFVKIYDNSLFIISILYWTLSTVLLL